MPSHSLCYQLQIDRKPLDVVWVPYYIILDFFFLFNLQVEEPITRRKTYPEKIEKQVSSLLPGNNRKITFGFLLCLVSVS